MRRLGLALVAIAAWAGPGTAVASAQQVDPAVDPGAGGRPAGATRAGTRALFPEPRYRQPDMRGRGMGRR